VTQEQDETLVSKGKKTVFPKINKKNAKVTSFCYNFAIQKQA